MKGGIGGLLNLKQSGANYSYLYDGKGSVAAVLDNVQAAVAAYAYDDFGNPLSKLGTFEQPMRFSTEPYDETTGLVRYPYRFYAPSLGRWLNRDPIGESGGLNLYGFVNNNPVNKIDPYGLYEWVNPVTYWGNFFGGAGDFTINYQNMRDANTIGADAYFHCMANCQASRRGPGGRDASKLISEGRELSDEYLKGNPRLDCDADRAANRQGRDSDPNTPCSQACGSLRPNGLDPRY